jgi:hypothetical protein
MISKQWRERLTYTVMSVFVGWHTLAVVVAPAPDDSVTVQSLRLLLHPYLTFVRLDNPWDFYAPIVGSGHQLRYVIEDTAGKRHTFVPTEELSWFHPSYWWFRAWYDAILEAPEIYGDFVVALLCRKHASLHPISITLLKIEQEHFSRTDHLSGKHPLNSEFVTENTLGRITCPDE